MRKIGLLTMALVLALGSLGLAYASWTDQVTIEGSVNTGTVDLEIVRYSGTWVWKVPEHGIVSWHGWTDQLLQNTPPDGELIAYAFMRPPEGDETADVVGVACNIFPFDSFVADVLLHYKGSIPAMVSAEQTSLLGDPELIAIMGWDYSIPEPKAIHDTATVGDYANDEFIPDASIQSPWGPGRINLYNGWQMHFCDYLLLDVVMNIPQDNDLQGKCATWGVNINAVQWNEFEA